MKLGSFCPGRHKLHATDTAHPLYRKHGSKQSSASKGQHGSFPLASSPVFYPMLPGQ